MNMLNSLEASSGKLKKHKKLLLLIFLHAKLLWLGWEELAFLPSFPNKDAPTFAHTSEENMVAQVPIHQHTTGLVIRPSLIPLQILYSSVPPICREKELSSFKSFAFFYFFFFFLETCSEMHMETLFGPFALNNGFSFRTKSIFKVRLC